jgi:hypothetical protein
MYEGYKAKPIKITVGKIVFTPAGVAWATAMIVLIRWPLTRADLN